MKLIFLEVFVRQIAKKISEIIFPVKRFGKRAQNWSPDADDRLRGSCRQKLRLKIPVCYVLISEKLRLNFVSVHLLL